MKKTNQRLFYPQKVKRQLFWAQRKFLVGKF